MFKQRHYRLLVIAVILCGVIFSSGALAGSIYTVKKIKALYSNLQIFVNEKPLESDVEPFIFLEKGVTMVPLRDICEALHLDVYWDNATNSIFVSNAQEVKPSDNYFLPQYKYWDETKPTVNIENIRVLRNVGPFYEKEEEIRIAGRPFYSGIVAEVDTPDEGETGEENVTEENKAEAVLDLYEKFATMEGYYGIDDETQNSSSGCTISFYGDGTLLYRTGIIRPAQYPILLPAGKVDLRDVYRLRIVVTWEETDSPGDYSRVMAALAKFKFYKK